MQRLLSEIPSCSPSESSDSRLAESTAHVPFQDLLLPLVNAATHRIADSAWHSLKGEARSELQCSLLQRLSKLGGAVFYAEFDAFRRQDRERSTMSPPKTGTANMTQAYDAFVESQRGDRMYETFVRYPVLLRLMAIVVDLWVESTRELLQRLQSDASLLQEFLTEPHSLGKVEHVQTGLSDPHQGGRSVMVLCFTSGRKLVYKPRARALDCTFFNLVEWLNDLQPGITLRAPRILDCGDYAWVEHMAHQDCNDEQEVATYYTRAGGLLALLYAVDANPSGGRYCGTNQDLILEDIEAALRGVQAYGLGAVDQLCCGNFGRIDLLLTAAERLQRPELAELAQRRTASLLQRRPAGTDFHYHHRMGCDAFNPGLFQGASGIGYQLLRMAFPTVLPSLLLFEPCLSASQQL